MKKIKLLHIITNLELGGAQKQALSLIAGIDSAKCEKYFISAPSGLLQEECFQMQDVHVEMLPALKRRISPWHDLLILVFLIKFIKKHSIDIVHTHSSKAGILGRWAAYIARVPVTIHTIHGWSFHQYLTFLPKTCYVLLERITARITTCLIAVSQSDIQKGIHNKIGTKKQYCLIRYGMTINARVEEKDKDEAKQKLGIDPNAVCVGMVACLKPQKNPLDFVRLAERINKKRQNVMFVCVGDGMLRARMEQLISQKKLNAQVKLCGWRKDMDRIFPALDVVVLTSLWEGLPIALMEAQAFSLPIVAYNCDGISEIVKEGENGYLVAPGDCKGLSEKVEFLLNNKGQAKQMGQRGRELFKQQEFTLNYMVSKTEQLYATLLQSGKARV